MFYLFFQDVKIFIWKKNKICATKIVSDAATKSVLAVAKIAPIAAKVVAIGKNHKTRVFPGAFMD